MDITKKVAQVAQSVEQRTENPCVGGSIPPLGKFLDVFFIFIQIFVQNLLKFPFLYFLWKYGKRFYYLCR